MGIFFLHVVGNYKCYWWTLTHPLFLSSISEEWTQVTISASRPETTNSCWRLGLFVPNSPGQEPYQELSPKFPAALSSWDIYCKFAALSSWGICSKFDAVSKRLPAPHSFTVSWYIIASLEFLQFLFNILSICFFLQFWERLHGRLDFFPYKWESSDFPRFAHSEAIFSPYCRRFFFSFCLSTTKYIVIPNSLNSHIPF